MGFRVLGHVGLVRSVGVNGVRFPRVGSLARYGCVGLVNFAVLLMVVLQRVPLCCI